MNRRTSHCARPIERVREIRVDESNAEAAGQVSHSNRRGDLSVMERSISSISESRRNSYLIHNSNLIRNSYAAIFVILKKKPERPLEARDRRARN